jgi:ketosteroid isomerase-like protein
MGASPATKSENPHTMVHKGGARMRHRHAIRFFLLFLLLPLADASPADTGDITDDRIRSIISSVDTATRQRNVDGIVIHFAPDCVITLNIPGPTGRQIIRMNVQEYRTNLQQGFSAATEYTYHREELKIEIAPGGKRARVTDQVVEVITINRQTIKSVTQETAIFELRAGKILITSLEGVVLSMEPGGRHVS